MRALLLVGGKATRLRPLTERTPKAMTPLLGRPFLEHVLAWLVRHDVREVTLLLGFLPGPIRDYFGDGGRFGVTLTYVVEDEPLGSGGAIKQVEADLAGTFLALNGDIFSNADLRRILAEHRRTAAEATIALYPIDDPSSYGVVSLDDGGRIESFVEKPAREQAPSNLANAGIWVLEPAAVARIAPGRFTMVEQDLFPVLARERRLFGRVIDAYWMDAGTPERYLQLHRDLLLGRVDGALALVKQPDWPGLVVRPATGAPVGEGVPPRLDGGARLTGPVVLGPDVELAGGCLVEGPASIGGRCRIGAGSRVADSVLWEDCAVGERAAISGSILARGCTVGAGASVEACVLGDGVRVHPGARARGLRVPPGARVEGNPATVAGAG
jgi:mannose-1-phosphate guanylyltransferase